MFDMYEDMFSYRGGVHDKSFKKMSNIVKYNNKTYFVDTANTFDRGLETMIFESGEQPETDNILDVDEKLINFLDLYVEHYSSGDQAIKRHNEIIKNIGKYLKKGGN